MLTASSTASAPQADVSVPTSTASALPPVEPPTPPDRTGACPSDTALVDGWYCPFVAHRCKKTRRAKVAGDDTVCDEFENEVLCEGTLERLRFCIDPYEYPNVEGMLPAVLVSFDEAARACEVEGKRLCSPRELAFACEGEAIHPYAVGEKRLEGACRWDAGPEGRVTPSRGPGVAAQLALVDKRAASGGSPACVSPFGISDLAGNVAEWAFDPQGSKRQEPFASVVVSGSWGSSASTCRTADASLPPTHRAATIGFRCCADAAPREGPPIPERKRGPGGGFRPIGSVP